MLCSVSPAPWAMLHRLGDRPLAAPAAVPGVEGTTVEANELLSPCFFPEQRALANTGDVQVPVFIVIDARCVLPPPHPLPSLKPSPLL